MLHQTVAGPRARAVATSIGALLLMEFVDELVDGALSAAWPAIRSDLLLSYAQVGLALGLPRLVGNAADVLVGVLADMGHRRALMTTGGVGFAAALALVAGATGFWALLAGLVLSSPASGAFVGLGQTLLMDLQPARREKNMTRWVVAGWLGNLLGPAMMGTALARRAGWRPPFAAIGALAALALLVFRTVTPAAREPGPGPASEAGRGGLVRAFRSVLALACRGEVIRWLVLLELADLMLDIFRGYLALYLVEVASADESAASLAVAVLTGAGLVGAGALVRMLDRVPGLVYLKASAVGVLVVFPLFLLAPALERKVALAAALGLLTSGWYPVLQARFYGALPGRSGAAVTISTLGGILGGLLPVALGEAAQAWGLGTMMWLLLAAPVSLLVGLPRR